MIAQLVAVPSVSSGDPALDTSNRGVVELLADWATSLGFAVRIDEVPGAVDKYNLVARLGQGEDGLVLSGHTDTVPYDAERWSSDPFVLSQRDDKLFGLGTADMKGFFAAALTAVARFEPAALRAPVTLLATADEESTMAGARALADSSERLGAYAIIGEPTGLQPVHKHKGVFMVRLSITGKSGHASDPALGVNAIEGLQQVLSLLGPWQAGLVERYRDDDFRVAGPTMNLGRVQGGDSFNRIASNCQLDLEFRLLPGMEPEAFLEELRAVVEGALRSGRWSYELSTVGAYDGFATPTDTAFSHEVATLCGCSAKAVMFGTEAPFLARLGLETLIVGAGDIRVAHQPDEYVTMTSIGRASDLYSQLIQRFCIEP